MGYIYLPLICFALNAASQVLSFRYLPGIGLLKSVFAGFLIGMGMLLYGEWRYSANIFLSAVNIIIYLALWNAYFHFVNMGETARRIRLLRELATSEDGLSLNELLARYNSKEIIERRLERFIKTGQVLLKDNRYYIGGPLLLFIARIITSLKIVFFGNAREPECQI